MSKRPWLFFGVLSCAVPLASGLWAETILLADIRRVVVIQEENGKTRRTEEPIEDKKTQDAEDSDKKPHPSHRHGKGSGSTYEPGPIDLSGPADTSPAFGFGAGYSSAASARFLSFGYSATHVFHTLTTRFESPAFNTSSWNTAPEIRGDGAEIAIHPIDFNGIGLGVRGGFFQDTHVANAQQAGALYVRERVHTIGGWANLEVQTAPFWGLSLVFGIGGLTYAVDTQVETNAPAYRYEGLTGSRTVMIYGLGGQFEVPWTYRVKPFVQGRYGWTAGGGDPFEHGIGQFNTGLLWRF